MQTLKGFKQRKAQNHIEIILLSITIKMFT